MEIEHDAHPWRPWTPHETARRLEGVAAPWAVAGGWALELFAGAPWREHEDLEIAVPAARFHQLREALAGLELWVPSGGGMLRPLEDLAEPGQTWALEPEADAWRLDVVRERSEGGMWVFRRDERVRMPQARVVETTTDGIPFQRPEVVLLFKAAAPREKDEVDVQRVVPLLDAGRRRWLAEALRRVHPGHAWLEGL